ncbi:cytochrome p450 [Trichoderma arundinaceum]|uniref:Cytochrome p450 n=1 Tax=Trichoderma arundinaceum TaxID=490622 RepID=A0A395NU87_TRIAR|nr:cytochrome p450 [Trichoderma arundinaceum]
MIILILVVLSVIYLTYRSLYPKPIPGIPHNVAAARSWLGDIPNMIREIASTPDLDFQEWCALQTEKLKSPLCQVFLSPFSKPLLLLADFDEARDLALRRTDDFDRGDFVSDSFGAFGNFHARMDTGPQFKANRRWLQDLMTPSFLNGFVAPSTYALVQQLVELWRNKARLAGDKPFSADADLDRVNFDIMMRLFFGEHFGSSSIDSQMRLLSGGKAPNTGLHGEAAFPEAPIHQVFYALHDAGRTVTQIMTSLWPKLTLRWIPWTAGYRRIQSAKKLLVREQVPKAIERVRSGEKSAGIDYILSREQAAAKQEDRKPEFDNEMIINEFFGIAYAGMDTTEANISWALKFMTNNSNVQDNLRRALHSAYPSAVKENRLPTIEEFLRTSSVPYLDALLEETLRLHPVLSARDAARDTEILGHHIPKGSTVLLLPNGPSFLSPPFSIDESLRSPTTRVVKPSSRWNETDIRSFNPERWLVRNPQGDIEFDATAGPQSAFGHGPRACWGRREAYLRMKIALTLLVWNFDFLEVSESLGSMSALPVFVHKPKQVFVRLRPRV